MFVLFLSLMRIFWVIRSETLTYQFGADQQKETKHINLSLTQLKTVITALSKREKFIPYRNSSLTKLLRKSLGGNAKTTLVCTMHPHPDQEKMSRNTLHFGDLAKKIVNSAVLFFRVFKFGWFVHGHVGMI